jgi:hypothetical protein
VSFEPPEVSLRLLVALPESFPAHFVLLWFVVVQKPLGQKQWFSCSNITARSSFCISE